MAGSKVSPAAQVTVLWVAALLVTGIAAAAAQEHASGGSAANSPAKLRRCLGLLSEAGEVAGDIAKGGRKPAEEGASHIPEVAQRVSGARRTNSFSTAGVKALGWFLPAIAVFLRME